LKGPNAFAFELWGKPRIAKRLLSDQPAGAVAIVNTHER